jgi:hypothetical protein
MCLIKGVRLLLKRILIFLKYFYKYNRSYTSMEFEPEAPQATVCC